MSADQQRRDAEAFCKTAIYPLCEEVLKWYDGGSLEDAIFFPKLVELCRAYYGIANGRLVAENMVKTTAMRMLAGS